jgi:hypothetical protein
MNSNAVSAGTFTSMLEQIALGSTRDIAVDLLEAWDRGGSKPRTFLLR